LSEGCATLPIHTCQFDPKVQKRGSLCTASCQIAALNDACFPPGCVRQGRIHEGQRVKNTSPCSSVPRQQADFGITFLASLSKGTTTASLVVVASNMTQETCTSRDTSVGDATCVFLNVYLATNPFPVRIKVVVEWQRGRSLGCDK